MSRLLGPGGDVKYTHVGCIHIKFSARWVKPVGHIRQSCMCTQVVGDYYQNSPNSIGYQHSLKSRIEEVSGLLLERALHWGTPI